MGVRFRWLLLLALSGGIASAGASVPPSPIANPQRPLGSTHWSFQPMRVPAVPKVKGRAWVRNPIDAFVLAKLEAKGLRPAPSADARTLIRRLYLDLLGVPPTPEDVEAFVAACAAERVQGSGFRLTYPPQPPLPKGKGGDRTLARVVGRRKFPFPLGEGLGERSAPASDKAYERLVDRLLADPRYGERWAQHWLDVVRFGETNGFELDQDRPQAWRYRDWVVRALIEDKPYDRFLTEQIAGDELDPNDFDRRVATGFLRAGPQHVVGGNNDPAVDRQEWLTEAVTGVGAAVMGVTIQCARCHDHKYDPIPQADYYRLQAFFAATDNRDYEKITPEQKQAYETAVKANQARKQPIQAEIAIIEKPYRERLRQQKLERLAQMDPKAAEAVRTAPDKRTPEQKKLASEAQVQLNLSWEEVVAVLIPADRERRAALRQKLHAIEAEAPEPLPAAPTVADVLDPLPKVHVLKGGDVHRPAEEVQPGFLTVLGGGGPDLNAAACGGKSGGRRLALARWLTRPDHPLTARVIVNRLWQRHFGRGIVATPNDFGKNGSLPTHPLLLDWLAAAFVRTPASGRGGVGERENGRVGGAIVRKGSHSSSFPLSHSAPKEVAAERWACGWSLKQLHRLIVTSSAYRQASTSNRAGVRSDPSNRLLWRQNRQRLDAEALRDSVLAVAGTLTPQLGGPPVRVPLEKEVYDTIFTEAEPDNLWPVTPDRRQHTRRSLYLLRKRNVRLPLFVVFDSPDMMTPCAARGESVHALQALTLMNSDFMQQQSRALARRLLTSADGTPSPGEVNAKADHLRTTPIHPLRGYPGYATEGSGFRVQTFGGGAAAGVDPGDARWAAVFRYSGIQVQGAGNSGGARRPGSQRVALAAAPPREGATALAPADREERQRIERLFLLALGRPPQPRELEATQRFLRDQTTLLRERIARGEPVTRVEGLPAGVDPAVAAAWVDLCLAMFNRNDFVYVK
jgi:hypothetical protein